MPTTTTTHDDAYSIAEDLFESIGDYILTREDLSDAVHEAVDSCSRVIYTSEAREAVCKHGTSAYTDRFGEEGLTKDGDINWGAIAYCIVEEMVWEALDSMGVEINEDDIGLETVV